MAKRRHPTRIQHARAGRPWRRLAWWFGAVIVVVVGLWAASTPILQWIGHQLIRADAIEPSDAIVELSGGEGDREIETADLFAAHAAPQIILTTERDSAGLPELRRRGVKAESGIERRKRYLTELGVPASAIVILPDQANSTVEETRIVASWIKTHPVRSIIVVSSAYHTRRSGHIFEWALRGTGVVVRTRPAAHDRYRADTWWTDRNTLLTGLLEWQKTIYYRLRYW